MRSRRGVLLLVVLSLLVLFTMIAVTFVLVAGQYRRSSRAAGRAEQHGDDPRKQLDEAFGQLVRDSLNPTSSLFRHSLLNDLYGTDGLKVQLNSAVPPVAIPTGVGQFIDFTFSGAGATFTQPPSTAGLTAAQFTQIKTAGYFNGCVLTMLDGVAAGQSTRIVGWGYDGTANYTVRVMAFEGITAVNVTGTRTVLINGRPFNGTGFGLDLSLPATAPTLLDSMKDFKVGLTSNLVPNALLPNPRFFLSNGGDTPSPSYVYDIFGGAGGADEDYDAPDPQNMHLAYVPIGPVTSPGDILPSFHRQDLINYLATFPAYASVWSDPTAGPRLLRQAMLRPIGSQTRINGVLVTDMSVTAPYKWPTTSIDHPNFTGSNPAFDAVRGPWDVDNDGDGVADSVWIDIGLPMQTAPDGRRFKPLVAILCTDLDGRLNVNAHGNYEQSQAGHNTFTTPLPTAAGNINNYLFNPAGTPTATVSLPRGSGYGPAEIDLGMAGLFTAPATYSNFFTGMAGPGGVTHEGRYGEFGSALPPRAGSVTLNRADDVLDRIKRFDFPTNYYGATLTNYGSPCDLSGRAVLGIDYAGQPIWSFFRRAPNPSDVLGTADNELPNDPYALNLSRRRGRSSVSATMAGDSAFTVAELERILRRYDLDATTLPDRLRYLLDPNSAGAVDLARMITTDSFDLPSPGILPTRDMLLGPDGQGATPDDMAIVLGRPATNLNLVDMLWYRLRQGGVPLASINAEIALMLPPEVVAGQRFDLNRPFGNGVDDDPNGVVDEPDEIQIAQEPTTWGGAFPTTYLDLNNDGTTDISDFYARQQYAKYLYVLMMLLADQQYQWSLEATSVTEKQELMARRIAQWAVNVVDFRDSDSIMTPFEYDVNPFNADGWNVDGVLGLNYATGSSDDNDPVGHADRRLVWGCEAPELILTEVLALHDRRVADTAVNKLRSDSTTPDPDYDQVRVPEGSVFFEMLCTHNGNSSTQAPHSQDLFDNNSPPRLKLGQLAPTGGGFQYPVWRIAVTASTKNALTGPNNDVVARIAAKPDTVNFDTVPPAGSPDPFHGSLFDFNNPTATGAAPKILQIERLVWFTQVAPNVAVADANISYYNNLGAVPLVNPGQYVVVGPRAATYVGLTTAGAGAAQQIVLNPGAGTVSYSPANATAPNATATSFPAVPLICSSVALPTGWAAGTFPNNIGLSISEPLFSGTYYPPPTNAGPTGITDKYAAALDHPLDGALGGVNAPLSQDPGMLTTGLKLNYKTALLQRLANPLAAYDPVLNPYITVDWQPIDLNVFNGETRQNATTAPNNDPDDPAFSVPPGPPATVVMGSSERGAATVANSILWNVLRQPTTTAAGTGATDVFDYNLNQSLGYLNKTLGTPWGPAAPAPLYRNAPNPTTNPNPFPWLTWNNRPFTSEMELLLVPATSAEQMMRQFSTTPAVAFNPYDATTQAEFRAPFSHLFNFFLASDGTGTSTAAGTLGAPYFYRLLDYVHVPSRFVGTETVLNPTNFISALPTAGGMTEAQLMSFYHPPFNRVSNYRDPGRVNINTIAGVAGAAPASPIWNAVLSGGPVPTWQLLVDSRRGNQAGNVTTLFTGAPLSSYFANPFRSAGGGAFRLPGTFSGTPPEIDVTLLRPDPGGTNPLFAMTAPPLPFIDPVRNPYFRYQPLTRLSNLLTTRSNLYAVWITLGNFEVSALPIDTAHPDGYQLGQELGSDSGEIKRHRAFYIFDRTIPVAFEPGHDHNIDRGLLLKRYIE